MKTLSEQYHELETKVLETYNKLIENKNHDILKAVIVRDYDSMAKEILEQIEEEGVKNVVQEHDILEGCEQIYYNDRRGVDILAFLRGADLNKYDEEVSKLVDAVSLEDKDGNNPHYDKLNKWVDEIQKKKLSHEEERKELQSNDEYYCLSRDCGSNLHKMIYEGRVKVVQLDVEGKDWCEGFYTIDLQKGTFHAEYHGTEETFKLSNLPTDEEFLEKLKDYE